MFFAMSATIIRLIDTVPAWLTPGRYLNLGGDVAEIETDSRRAKMPHCDTTVLHSPLTCQYCDQYPDRQWERIKHGINFTGENDAKKAPCPSSHRSLAHVEAWPGNRPEPLDPIRDRNYRSAQKRLGELEIGHIVDSALNDRDARQRNLAMQSVVALTALVVLLLMYAIFRSWSIAAATTSLFFFSVLVGYRMTTYLKKRFGS